MSGVKGTAFEKTVALKSGENDISLLSVMVGLPVRDFLELLSDIA